MVELSVNYRKKYYHPKKNNGKKWYSERRSRNPLPPSEDATRIARNNPQLALWMFLPKGGNGDEN